MNKFISNKKLIGILVSVITISALTALSLNRQGNVNAAQASINDLTAFVGKVITAPINFAADSFDSINNLTNTYEENRHLKSQMDEMEELQTKLTTVEAENQQLKDELSLNHSLSEYEKIHATIISRNPDNWIDQIVIDKGSENGVELGMSILSQNGLVGRVSEVSPTSSKVTLVTTLDQRENLVSAEVQLEEDEVAHGVIQSYDKESDRLIMDQITTETPLQEGQEVVTSGLSDMTPRSLKIGTVDEVAVGDFGLTQKVYITPAANFNDIRYVTVIKRLAESGE